MCPALALYARQWIDRASAEDAVQNALIALLVERQPPRNRRAWMFRAVRNAAVDSARSAARRRRREQSVALKRRRWFLVQPVALLDAQSAEKGLRQIPLEADPAATALAVHRRAIRRRRRLAQLAIAAVAMIAVASSWWALDPRDQVRNHAEQQVTQIERPVTDQPRGNPPTLLTYRAALSLSHNELEALLEEENTDRARDDTYGMMSMARQIGNDHTLVSMLVCYSIEENTVGVVAPYLPELDTSYEDALATFESLPPSPQVEHGVLCEKRMMYSIVNLLEDTERRSPGSWRKTWISILGEGGTDPLPNVQDLSELVTIIEEFQSVYDELVQLAKLAPREFDEKFPAFVESAKSASPIATILLPAMDKVVSAQRHSDARTAMLLAGIAVVEGGREKLGDIKDPFGDGPFGYRELDEGFELSSQLLEDGKPDTRTIGQKSATSTP